MPAFYLHSNLAVPYGGGNRKWRRGDSPNDGTSSSSKMEKQLNTPCASDLKANDSMMADISPLACQWVQDAVPLPIVPG
jgi:hypothetical protein